MTDRVSARAPPRAPLYLALGCVGFLSSPALAEDRCAAAGQDDVEQSDVQQRDRNVVVTGERRATPASNRPRRPPICSIRRRPSPSSATRPCAARICSPCATRSPPFPASPSAPARAAAAMAIRSTCAAMRRATTSPRTASATAPSTAAPIRSTCSRSKSTTAPTRCSTARAAVGGTINLVSKVPQADDLTILSAAVGTDNYLPRHGRHQLAGQPSVAVRLNAMVHRNDVPGRDVENYRRWGVAPAITFGIGGADQPDARLCPPARRQYPDLRRPLFPQPAQRRAAARGRRQRLFRLSQPRRAGDRRSTGSPRPSATISAPNFSVRNLAPLAAGRSAQPDQRAAGHLLPVRHRPPAGLGGGQRHDRRALHGLGRLGHHRQRPRRRHDRRPRPAGLLAAVRPARPAPRPVERALLHPDRFPLRKRRAPAGCTTSWSSAAPSPGRIMLSRPAPSPATPPARRSCCRRRASPTRPASIPARSTIA